jgi:hypothetical protein
MPQQGSSLQALQSEVPPHQAFTGHTSAVLGTFSDRTLRAMQKEAEACLVRGLLGGTGRPSQATHLPCWVRFQIVP